MKDFTEGTDFYFNEQGLMVLTEAYHLKKGYCCGQGCLHCPYHHENVPVGNKIIQKKKPLPGNEKEK